MDDRTYSVIADHMSLLQQAEAENARLTEELDTRIRELMQASRKLAATRRANTANAKAAADHWQTAQTLTNKNNRLRDNAAELGKALDMALAERDGAFAELDALRANRDSHATWLRAESERLRQQAIEQDAAIAMSKRITHCENCGGSWYDYGLTPSCPLCAWRQLEDERLRLIDERDANGQRAATAERERNAARAELADTETRARLASDLLQDITEDLAHERQQRRELERQLDAMRQAHSVIAGRMEAMGC